MDARKVSYVEKAYRRFYKKNGYLPIYFNAYNCSEIKDIAPTITTQCGSSTSSSSILIIEQRRNDCGQSE